MEGKAFASATTTSATQQEQRIVTQELKRTQQVLTSDLSHGDVNVSSNDKIQVYPLNPWYHCD